jgi:hypothetical protein
LVICNLTWANVWNAPHSPGLARPRHAPGADARDAS